MRLVLIPYRVEMKVRFLDTQLQVYLRLIPDWLFFRECLMIDWLFFRECVMIDWLFFHKMCNARSVILDWLLFHRILISLSLQKFNIFLLLLRIYGCFVSLSFATLCVTPSFHSNLRLPSTP